MKQTEIDVITEVHRRAFGPAEGPQIASLAADLLALPETISVSAKRNGRIVGNVLFTPYVFEDHPGVLCYLLSPMAVLPDLQGQGVGREVMETGIAHLRSIGTEAVFVLGVPGFYPKYGFTPTDRKTPYPDLLTVPDAWMALELKEGSVARLNGKTTAVAPFMLPEMWDTSSHG